MDQVHPDHYKTNSFECIDVIKDVLTEEEFKGFLKGNVFKYLWRCDKKGQVLDLKKCRYYISKLIEQYELESLPATVVLKNSEGCLIEEGKIYFGDDGVFWKVTGFSKDKDYPVIGYNKDKGTRWLKLEWLHSLSVDSYQSITTSNNDEITAVKYNTPPFSYSYKVPEDGVAQ